MRNVGPLLGTVPLHQRQHELVLILGPGALDELRIQHFLPTMEALDVSAALQTLRNLLPVLGSILVDQLSQLFVLFFIPVSFVVLGILTILVHLHHRSMLDIGHSLVSKAWR